MFFPLSWQHTDTHTIPVRGGVLHESQKLTTRPLRSLAVKALRGMPPTLFNSAASRPRCKSASPHVAGPPVLFTNRSITRCLGHVGDRQIFNFTVSGAPGSTYPGRRHAAEALNGEAAKRPSQGVGCGFSTARGARGRETLVVAPRGGQKYVFLRIWGALGGQRYVFLRIWGAPGGQKYVFLRVWGALRRQRYVF